MFCTHTCLYRSIVQTKRICASVCRTSLWRHLEIMLLSLWTARLQRVVWVHNWQINNRGQWFSMWHCTGRWRFDIKESVEQMCAEVRSQLDAKDIEETRDTAHLRVHVERVCKECNKYKILPKFHEYGFAMWGWECDFLGQSCKVCCSLTNMSKCCAVIAISHINRNSENSDSCCHNYPETKTTLLQCFPINWLDWLIDWLLISAVLE